METTKVKFKYKVNGQEYNSLEEIPKEFRHLFNDENKDGIPDIIQGKNLLTFKAEREIVRSFLNVLRGRGIEPANLFRAVIVIALLVGLVIYFLVRR